MRHDAILCHAMMPLSKVSMEVPAALYMEALTASRRSRGMQPGRAALDHGAMEITKK